MSGPSSITVRRQRRSSNNGRIMRRQKTPRPFQSRPRAESISALVHKPCIKKNLPKQSRSDIYVEDKPFNLSYHTSSIPGSFPSKHSRAMPSRPEDMPQPRQPHNDQDARTFLVELMNRLNRQGPVDVVVINEQAEATVYERDFRLLLNYRHVNDNLVDYYLQLVVARCLRLQPGRKVVAVSASETRRIIRARAPLPPTVAGVHFIIFPVRFVDNWYHSWKVVIADIANAKVTSYNPTEKGDSYAITLARAIANFFPGTRNRLTLDEAVVSDRCPDEHVSLTGVHICNFVDYFFTNEVPSFRADSMYFFILQFLYELCKNEVPQPNDKCWSVENMAGFIREFYATRTLPPLYAVVARGDDMVVDTYDMFSLKSDCILSENVVDMYFLLMKDHVMRQLELDEMREFQFSVISATFSESLQNGNIELMESVFNREREHHIIFFPMRLGLGWVLLLIVRSARSILYFDPKVETNMINFPECVQNIPRVYRSFAGYEVLLKRNIPFVVNTFDSGVYICQYARLIIERIPLTEYVFTDLDMSRFRKAMERELVANELGDLERE